MSEKFLEYENKILSPYRLHEDGEQKTEDRGQKTEDRGQKTDDGGWKRLTTEDGGWVIEFEVLGI